MLASLGGENNVGFDLGGRYFVFLDKLEDDCGMGIRVPLLRLGCNCFELDVIWNEKLRLLRLGKDGNDGRENGFEDVPP